MPLRTVSARHSLLVSESRGSSPAVGGLRSRPPSLFPSPREEESGDGKRAGARRLPPSAGDGHCFRPFRFFFAFLARQINRTTGRVAPLRTSPSNRPSVAPSRTARLRALRLSWRPRYFSRPGTPAHPATLFPTHLAQAPPSSGTGRSFHPVVCARPPAPPKPTSRPPTSPGRSDAKCSTRRPHAVRLTSLTSSSKMPYSRPRMPSPRL